MKRDVFLLLAGIPRPFMWLFAAVMCARVRDLLPAVAWITVAGCAINAYNTLVFTLSNAHYHLPDGILTATILLSNAGVALTVTGIALMISYLLSEKHRASALHDQAR